MRLEDKWGQEITLGSDQSISAWNEVMDALLGFYGDPIALAQRASLADSKLFITRVFEVIFRLMSGHPPSLIVPRLTEAAAFAENITKRERTHLKAAALAAQGNFGDAARAWDAILCDYPTDVLALKASHEAYFLVGDKAAMLSSATRSVKNWPPQALHYGSAVGQHAFALEENDDYAESEASAKLGLELNGQDVWSAHALAHVYEMQERQSEALAFLETSKPRWENQNLSGHMAWHLALRHLGTGDIDGTLDIYKRVLAKTLSNDWFRLTDASSLLWRLNLLGVPTDEHWANLKPKWLDYGNLHTSPFLDMHAAMAIGSTVAGDGDAFLETFVQTPFPDTSEIYKTQFEVTYPLCQALFAYTKNDLHKSISLFEGVLPQLYRCGGSLAQRQTIDRTYVSALLQTGLSGRAKSYAKQELKRRPTSSWALATLETGYGPVPSQRIADL